VDRFVDAKNARGEIGGHGNLTVAKGNLVAAFRAALGSRRKRAAAPDDPGEAAA
jgi:hypothetical protein